MLQSRTAACPSAKWNAAGLGLALFFSSAHALADKVAVLPFSAANSSATKADLGAARTATQSAVVKVGHKEPTPSEMLTAEMAVKDGVADTSDEYRAAGRASSSQWTVSARVDPRSSGYRIELEVCQVKSGRVESLAREIDAPQAVAQISEMLAILLRPEGIANADIAWARTAPQLPPASPAPVALPAPAAPGADPAPASPAPLGTQQQPAAPLAQGERYPFAVGIGLGALAAFVRPSNAQGNATSLFLSGSLGYAIDAVPGLELRADFGGAVAGPQALMAEAGARYLRVLEPKLHIYAGPEVEIGGFFTRGADKSGRFLARGALVGGIGLTERIAVELSGDLAVAPGGAGTLVFGGASARGVFRF